MESKIIVITGSTRGIGFNMAKHFLQQGHYVALNGRSEQSVNLAKEKLNDYKSNIISVVGDVVDSHTHETLVNETKKAFGKIDIWINNAGLPQPFMNFVEIEVNTIKNIESVNVCGVMSGTRTALNFMMRQGYGKIFNMEGFGSNGRMRPKLTLYGTTKRAVNYFTKSLSKELKNTPVQIGILSPGMVRTDFLEGSKLNMSEKDRKQFDKVYKILSEDVDVVTKYLTKHIIASKKNYDRIEYLTKYRLFVKLIKLALKR